VTTAAAGASLTMTVHCDAAQSARSVRYPTGQLYVGATLYKLDDGSLRTATTRMERAADGRDLPSIEITRPDSTRDVTFALGNIGDWTHYLVAVWDKKNVCKPDDDNPACKTFGFTLGAVDDTEFPIPVDTFPRPACNVAQLTSLGYFDAVEKGDIQLGGQDLDDKFVNAYALNDCWKRFANRPGLGYSVRRWTIAPLKP
jgi:hypothetical protein